MYIIKGTTIWGIYYLPEVGKMRRRLLLRFPLRLLLYTCGLGHVESATSSPHMAKPTQVSPQEIPRASAYGGEMGTTVATVAGGCRDVRRVRSMPGGWAHSGCPAGVSAVHRA